MKKLLLTLTVFTLATPFFANAYENNDRMPNGGYPIMQNKEEAAKKMAEFKQKMDEAQEEAKKKIDEERKKMDDLQKDVKDIKKQLEEIKALLKK
jgi:peptidoglycan hydrolase CwlO-like protein